MIRLLACATAGILLAGCSDKPGEPFTRQPTYPVQGRLTIEGKPAGGAEITFVPAAPEGWQGPFPTAYVEDDGRFKARTYEDADGAPAGKYILTVVWPEASEKDERPDRLKGRYTDTTKGLPRAEVQARATQLPDIKLR